MSLQENKLYYLLLLFTALFWGISWPVARVLVFIAPPMTIGFFRFLTALLCFIPVLLITRQSLEFRWETVKWYIVLGFTGFFAYGVFFLVGMRFTTAAQGSIIAGVNPVSISLFAHIIHGERLDRWWKYTGFVFSFTGVIFVIGVQAIIDYKPEYLLGNIIILAAMICMGIYSNLGKKFMENHSSLEATTGAVLVATIFFGFGAVTEEFWVLESLVDPVFITGVLVLGILVTSLGFLFFFIAVRNIGATKSGIFINLVPVFGTLSSALFLGETIYWTFILGLGLIITGIFIINTPVKEIN